MPLGRYVALLVSLHGTGLYERYTSWQGSPESSRIVQAFLNQEKDGQQQLIAKLQQDPYYQPHVMPEAIARNQSLVAIWDLLSLILCMGLTQERQVEQVPTATGKTTLTLVPNNNNSTQVKVEPWCFQSSDLALVFEGRILRETAKDEQTMRHQLEQGC